MLFSWAGSMMADPVDLAEAKRIAALFLGKSVVTDDVPASANMRKAARGVSSPAFHILNAEDGNGFVIVSGESALPEILAYSDTGVFNTCNMHPSLEGLLQSYTELVEEVRAGNVKVEDCFPAAAQNKTRSGLRKAKAVVAALCKCNWGQGEPYNTLCPKIGSEPCPVGCVATAMAQIMYHFEWPKVGIGSNRYASGISGVGVISSNFSAHQYDWASMFNTTSENLASEEAAAAVAQISYDCGIATRMTYAIGGSGTNDDLAMAAMSANFGYKASTLHIEYRECYATQEEWNQRVKDELNANRPVLYGGYSATGGGHEFIIDGYDTNDYFHVNWGWDGTSNGYYLISTLKPSKSSTAYSKAQSMVCGIEPDTLGTDKVRAQWRIYVAEPPQINDESVDLGGKFVFSNNLFYNYSRMAGYWYCGAAIFDLNGKMIKLVSSNTVKNKYQILSFYGMNYLDLTCTMPSNLPEGDYVLRAVFREDGYDKWELPNMVGGSELNKIPMYVENGVAYFNTFSSGISPLTIDSSDVVSTAYFDLQGRKVTSPSKGSLVIKREELSNGEQRAYKIIAN